MRQSLIFLIAAAGGATVVLATGGAAQQGVSRAEANYTRLIAGKTPGKPVDCIDTRFNNPALSAYGDKLLYRVSRNLVYVNQTAGGCEAVARNDVLITIRYQTRACRGDIAQTVDRQSGMPTGSCSLGSFTPYTAAR